MQSTSSSPRGVAGRRNLPAVDVIETTIGEYASTQLEPGFGQEEEVLESAWNYTRLMLEDLPGYWNRRSEKQRPMFLRAVYPEGLTVSEQVIGPGNNPCFFLVSEDAQARDEDLVAPTRFELALLP